MIAESYPQINALPASQKLLLASELWDSALAEDLDIPASEALLAELDRRHAEYLADPSKVTTWEDAKARILASRD